MAIPAGLRIYAVDAGSSAQSELGPPVVGASFTVWDTLDPGTGTQFTALYQASEPYGSLGSSVVTDADGEFRFGVVSGPDKLFIEKVDDGGPRRYRVLASDGPTSGGGGSVSTVAGVAPVSGDIPAANLQAALDVPTTVAGVGVVGGDVPLADLQDALDVVQSVAGVGAGADGNVSATSLATALSVLQASLLTTKGDVFVRTSTGVARLPVGADGTRLTADSSTTFGVAWAAAGTSTTTPRFVYRASDGSWPARPDSNSALPVWWIDGTNTTPTDPTGKINGADYQIGPA